MIPPRIGRYEIQGELGRGGMAVVYRGLDPVLKRPTALKVLRKADLDPAEAAPILERFKREAEAAGSLHHPNIVAIYEYGEDAEYEWIAMELVEGRSLREHLRAGWRPDLSRLPSVLEQLLEALDYSHGRGVIHRDVKPGNVLVSDMGVAKMSDFGIARIERSHMTQAGELLGTPSYMAPEQYEGKPVDERTDIYSAAVIVYEVLTGRRPFDGQAGHLMHQILTAPPPPASTYEPRLPVTIDMVLARALSKKRASRPKGAREFLDALRHAFPATSPGAAPEKTQPMPAPLAPAPAAPAEPAAPARKGLAGNVGALRKALGAAPPAPAAADRREISRPAPRRPSVLFVDDEERVLNALASVFHDLYEVETAGSGRLALERLKARRFHVLVSDQRMPEMVGVELLREAKALAPGTVRLLLTGYSDLAAIVGSVNESEVFRFVSKPWQEEDLKATLAEAVDVAIALEVAALAPATAIPADSTVLVMGEPALARGARELAKGGYRVTEAAGMDAALEALAAEDVAVLVCDIDGAGDPPALLRVLKEQSPHTQLIAVSAAADSEQVIGLINEARIVRFLAKPVNLSLLQGALGAALQRHARLRKSPEWLRSEGAKKRRQASAGEQSLLGRLKALGGRFAAVLRR